MDHHPPKAFNLLSPYLHFKNLSVFLFFAIFLIIGVLFYKDYGLSWDEITSHHNGVTSYNYVFKGDPALFEYKDKDYGVAFELPLVVLIKLLNLKDLRDIFFFRHLCTFLLFYASVFIFYFLCKQYFDSRGYALLACLILVLSPRIFAHSFYNSKDIAFLSMFTISMFTMIKYFEHANLIWAFIHALACGILIDIRILGILIPCMTVFFVFLYFLPWVKGNKNQRMLSLVSFILLSCLFTVLFWPYLWIAPITNFVHAFSNMSTFRWDGIVLFSGQFISSKQLPWHYILTWIFITTPLLYTTHFLVGIFSISRSLASASLVAFFSDKRQKSVVFLLWFFLPIASVIIFDSVLYDAWRHLFFVYPALVLISVDGMRFLFDLINHKLRNSIRLFANAAYVIICISCLLDTAFFMIKYHPYQNVYFNKLAGDNMSTIKKRFELDYWGLSYRKALEYILLNDLDDQIEIYAANYPGRLNAFLIPPEDRKRLIYVDNINNAKYFISNYRGHPDEYTNMKEFFSIQIDGAKIIGVYKLLPS